MFLDAPAFVLDRARIPTPLFEQIIEDMSLDLSQFGPPDRHRTEEARTRFLAPVRPACPCPVYCTSANLLAQAMNRLVAQFHLLVQNTPESIIQGRITTKGLVKYQFKVCGALTILFVEAKLRLGSYDGRLNAIAQVVAEADGISPPPLLLSLLRILIHGLACDFTNNKLDVHTPLYTILCDGRNSYFVFDGHTRPRRFSRGCSWV